MKPLKGILSHGVVGDLIILFDCGTKMGNPSQL
jgi:hypothetical protein